MSEPMNCHGCHRRIGAKKTHYLIDALPGPLCIRCLNDRDMHRAFFPDCDHRWHDMQDHGPVVFATRAAANRLVRWTG